MAFIWGCATAIDEQGNVQDVALNPKTDISRKLVRAAFEIST